MLLFRASTATPGTPVGRVAATASDWQKQRRGPVARSADLGGLLHRGQRLRALASDGQLWYWYVAGPEERPAGSALVDGGVAKGAAAGARARPVHELGRTRRRRSRTSSASGRYFYLYLPRAGSRAAAAPGRRPLDATASTGRSCAPIRSSNSGDAGTFDENGLGEPAVWSSHGFYWMLYTGRDRGRDAPPGPGAFHATASHWTKLARGLRRARSPGTRR